ncbi:hypothetical protein ACD661_08815 [Legionella lytica]|uniref:Uncharacterized protein n=1 Tax=Legionella lytica TaxID=96232 RepID=A0ABW8D9I4_9GAMM
MIKQVIFIICMMFIKNISFSASINETLGRWCWDLDNKKKAFFITIKKHAGKFYGGYDSVVDFGAKIDDNDNAFSFTQIKNNMIKMKIKSGINGGMGLVQLNFLKNNKIKWTVIHQPKGEFYAPRQALLHKC